MFISFLAMPRCSIGLTDISARDQFYGCGHTISGTNVLDLRDKLGLNPDFTIHSLRHTMLIQFGECGADAFTIKRIAGRSSITISERYVHPTPEPVERTFERFEAYAVSTVFTIV